MRVRRERAGQPDHTGIRDRVHSYLSATLKHQGAYPLAVGGWLDQVHVFFELPMTIAFKDLMRDLKAHSSKWIHESN
jgi:hypothetical protein